MASTDQPFYSPNRQPTAARTSKPGLKLWELHDGDRVLICEIRDDDRVAAGVDVALRLDGELLLSKRCLMADAARYVAQAFKNAHLRQGWTESA